MKNIFSFQIIKQSFKSSWVWWLISCFVPALNILVFPSSAEMADKSKLLSAFVETGISFNGIVFIIIFAIICANVFITSEVDKGTLAITLNTPTTRKQILFSKMLVFVALLITISLFVGAIGTVSPLMFGIKGFEFAKWWTIVALWCLYSFLVGGIVFAIACWFNKSRYTMATSALILGAFFILSMLSQMDNFEFCKYLTLQTLFNMDAVIKGNSVIWQIIVMPVLAIPFYAFGIAKFSKKDLPL